MDRSDRRLSRIRISGYKSIKECSIELGRFNILIGSNGAGKSNFLSAITFVDRLLKKTLQITAGIIGHSSLFYNGRKQTDEISFEVFFDSDSYGFDLTTTDSNKLIFKREFFSSYPNNLRILSEGHRESVWDMGEILGTNTADKNILAKEDDGSAGSMNFLGSLNWQNYHFHDTSASAKIRQECSLANDHMLLCDGRNLAAYLYRIKHAYPESYRDIVSTVQIVAPYFDDFFLEPQELNPEQIILKWKQKGLDDVFFASQFSDGTIRFICLAVLLLQPACLQPQTIIIDEPELGLHPFAITILAETIRQLPEDKQIIISTQSAEFLNEFDPKDIIVVDRGESGSIFKRLDPDDLSLWLENDYALGELWKKNIFGGRLS